MISFSGSGAHVSTSAYDSDGAVLTHPHKYREPLAIDALAVLPSFCPKKTSQRVARSYRVLEDHDG